MNRDRQVEGAASLRSMKNRARGPRPHENTTFVKLPTIQQYPLQTTFDPEEVRRCSQVAEALSDRLFVDRVSPCRWGAVLRVPVYHGRSEHALSPESGRHDLEAMSNCRVHRKRRFSLPKRIEHDTSQDRTLQIPCASSSNLHVHGVSQLPRLTHVHASESQRVTNESSESRRLALCGNESRRPTHATLSREG